MTGVPARISCESPDCGALLEVRQALENWGGVTLERSGLAPPRTPPPPSAPAPPPPSLPHQVVIPRVYYQRGGHVLVECGSCHRTLRVLLPPPTHGPPTPPEAPHHPSHPAAHHIPVSYSNLGATPRPPHQGQQQQQYAAYAQPGTAAANGSLPGSGFLPPERAGSTPLADGRPLPPSAAAAHPGAPALLPDWSSAPGLTGGWLPPGLAHPPATTLAMPWQPPPPRLTPAYDGSGGLHSPYQYQHQQHHQLLPGLDPHSYAHQQVAASGELSHHRGPHATAPARHPPTQSSLTWLGGAAAAPGATDPPPASWADPGAAGDAVVLSMQDGLQAMQRQLQAQEHQHQQQRAAMQQAQAAQHAQQQRQHQRHQSELVQRQLVQQRSLREQQLGQEQEQAQQREPPHLGGAAPQPASTAGAGQEHGSPLPAQRPAITTGPAGTDRQQPQAQGAAPAAGGDPATNAEPTAGAAPTAAAAGGKRSSEQVGVLACGGVGPPADSSTVADQAAKRPRTDAGGALLTQHHQLQPEEPQQQQAQPQSQPLQSLNLLLQQQSGALQPLPQQPPAPLQPPQRGTLLAQGPGGQRVIALGSSSLAIDSRGRVLRLTPAGMPAAPSATPPAGAPTPAAAPSAQLAATPAAAPGAQLAAPAAAQQRGAGAGAAAAATASAAGPGRQQGPGEGSRQPPAGPAAVHDMGQAPRRAARRKQPQTTERRDSPAPTAAAAQLPVPAGKQAGGAAGEAAPEASAAAGAAGPGGGSGGVTGVGASAPGPMGPGLHALRLRPLQLQPQLSAAPPPPPPPPPPQAPLQLPAAPPRPPPPQALPQPQPQPSAAQAHAQQLVRRMQQQLAAQGDSPDPPPDKVFSPGLSSYLSTPSPSLSRTPSWPQQQPQQQRLSHQPSSGSFGAAAAAAARGPGCSSGDRGASAWPMPSAGTGVPGLSGATGAAHGAGSGAGGGCVVQRASSLPQPGVRAGASGLGAGAWGSAPQLAGGSPSGAAVGASPSGG